MYRWHNLTDRYLYRYFLYADLIHYDLDLFQEMAITAKLHKVVNNDPTILPAKTVMEMATIRGAEEADTIKGHEICSIISKNI